MQVDPRVEFASSQAPVNQSLAKAAIELADAFAKGDNEALRKLLDKSQTGILDSLLASEQWYDATEPIEAVRVVSIDPSSRLNPDPQTTKLAIAIQDPSGAYMLGWTGRKVFDDWLFTAVPTDATEQRSVKAFDGRMPTTSAGMEGVDASSLFAGIPAEALTMMAQFGLDPTNPDPLRLQNFLDKMGDRLPADIVETLRVILAALQALSGNDDAGADASGGGDSADQPQRPPRSKNTPSGLQTALKGWARTVLSCYGRRRGDEDERS